MIAFDHLLAIAGLLLLVSLLTSKASGRLGLPTLVFFLVVGMVAGSEGLGRIEFDNPGLAQSLGIVALAFILFSGGLDTDWREVRPIMWPALGLSTIAVVITALSTGLIAAWLLNLPLLTGLLLGAIASSTDAAAVFSVMRSKGVNLRARLERLLEFESGSNDPMAIFLTIGLIALLASPNASPWSLIPMFVQQMVVGGLVGIGLGRLMVGVINRIQLGYDGLYPVFTVSIVLLVYGLATVLGGNGFLASYLAGLIMNRHDFIHKRSIRRFHDGLAWLMQIAMFIILGLLVFPSQLVPVIGVGLILSLFLIFIARPLGVFIALAPWRLGLREKLLISWVGLRGAVPIILATYPLVAGVAGADLIFNVVFFIVITSVLIQGPTISPVAKWLGLDLPAAQAYRYPLELEQTAGLDSQLVDLEVVPDSAAIDKQIVELHLPEEVLIVLISREDAFIVPRGATVLHVGDRLLVLGPPAEIEKVRSLLGIVKDSRP